MNTVNKIAKLTGISVRTLHYYDELGLLKPSHITEAGYRLYDDNDLSILQQILFFKELDFSLNDIKKIIENPTFDRNKAFENQKALLILKRNRLNDLINLINNTLKGEADMSFKEFDMTEIETAQKKYADEVKQRWGNTSAYAESIEKTSKYTKEDWQKISTDEDKIYKAFADNMKNDFSSSQVQQLVADWQNHITNNYYQCTNEILSCLGEMYVTDSRFTENIDKYGKGLAEFINKAIQYYCDK